MTGSKITGTSQVATGRAPSRRTARSAARRLYLDLCGLFVEPLRFPGRYRFGDSDLTRRVRARGFEALIEHPLPQPSPEILFIHRKLIGSFLLCAHIGASVDCRPLYRELVAGA